MTSPRTRGFIIGTRAGLLSGIIVVLISLKYPFVIYAYIVWILASGLGAYYGARSIQRVIQNPDRLRLLFWSNAITWLVPPIGFFTCGATRTINSRNHDEDRKLYARLAAVCFWLSLINAIVIAKYLT